MEVSGVGLQQPEQLEHCHKFPLGLLTQARRTAVPDQEAASGLNDRIGCRKRVSGSSSVRPLQKLWRNFAYKRRASVLSGYELRTATTKRSHCSISTNSMEIPRTLHVALSKSRCLASMKAAKRNRLSELKISSEATSTGQTSALH